MTQATVTTETDLATGSKTFVLPANPVPVITPMGPAPGELRVSADAGGRVTAVRAVLRPRASDVATIADVLSKLATFDLPERELRGLSGQPIVTFALNKDAVAEIKTPVRSAPDLQAFLGEAVLAQGERYALDDLEVTS
ncbi:MAG: hypothetical protein JWM80_4062 [Cyanobacteria bacterium RYN_339]|nr:hypothetical protein [Cyanobacteria bacterium RYN_339]